MLSANKAGSRFLRTSLPPFLPNPFQMMLYSIVVRADRSVGCGPKDRRTDERTNEGASRPAQKGGTQGT